MGFVKSVIVKEKTRHMLCSDVHVRIHVWGAMREVWKLPSDIQIQSDSWFQSVLSVIPE
jgi:hypothetical protein